MLPLICRPIDRRSEKMKSIIYFLILLNGMVSFNVHAQLDRSHIVWPAQGGRTDTHQKPLPTTTLTKNHYQKIIIPKNETYALEVDSVHIDTLILKDKSTLKCMNSNSMVIIDNALIGEKCTFDAAGTNGVN